jgi:hypothetical protein
MIRLFIFCAVLASQTFASSCPDGDCLEVMDVNGNGAVSNADAVVVKQAAFSMIIGDLWAIDINGNGVITNADAVFIQQAVFDLPPMDACF